VVAQHPVEAGHGLEVARLGAEQDARARRGLAVAARQRARMRPGWNQMALSGSGSR